jgi:cysteine desulfurase/selenocysteine lyase
MSFDVRSFKALFPGLDDPSLIYLDSAATAQMPAFAADAMRAHELHARANVHRGNHRLAEKAGEAYDLARRRAAAYLKAEPSEIVFTAGATAALNLAAFALTDDMQAGDEVLLSVAEHHSNLLPWQQAARRKGLVLKFLGVTEYGRIDLSRLDALLTPRAKAIAITQASNVTGAVTDLGPLASAAKSFGIPLLVDGAQGAPHGPADPRRLGADLYALAGHKCFGPMGIGVLWGKPELLEKLPPFQTGGGMVGHVSLEGASWAKPPARFEAGTPPVAAAVGLGVTLDWLKGLDWPAIFAHQRSLAERLLAGLAAIKGVRLYGPASAQDRVPVFSMALEGAHPHDVCQVLDRRGLALRGGHHCAEPLMTALGVEALFRASLAPYNGESDIDALLEGIGEAKRVLL